MLRLRACAAKWSVSRCVTTAGSAIAGAAGVGPLAGAAGVGLLLLVLDVVATTGTGMNALLVVVWACWSLSLLASECGGEGSGAEVEDAVAAAAEGPPSALLLVSTTCGTWL